RASDLARECFSFVDSLNNVYSDYTITSETGKLTLQSINTPVKVSDELFAMIVRSKQAWIASEKTFDITIGALTHLWRKAKAEKRFPSAMEIKLARQSSGFQNLNIQRKSQTI